MKLYISTSVILTKLTRTLMKELYASAKLTVVAPITEGLDTLEKHTKFAFGHTVQSASGATYKVLIENPGFMTIYKGKTRRVGHASGKGHVLKVLKSLP